MSLKDYYKILEVSSSATLPDIKKSYRRLALKYHPDKNHGDKLYEAKFKEILEAYKILSDEKKRQDFNYKLFDQQTILNKKPPTVAPANAALVVQKSIELRRKVSLMNADRINKDALYEQLINLLSTTNIRLLKDEKNFVFIQQVINNSLFATKHLDYDTSEKVVNLLASVSLNNIKIKHQLEEFLKQKKLDSLWIHYKLFFAMLFAILFCLLIYYISS